MPPPEIVLDDQVIYENVILHEDSYFINNILNNILNLVQKVSTSR